MKKKRLTHFLLAASASLALFGCKPSEPETEMKAVEQFRTMLAASQYHEIYLASSEMLRKKVSEGELVRLLESARADLGACKKFRLHERGTTTYAKGLQLVRLTYDSTFADGGATEEGFAFEKTQSGLKLAGYWYRRANVVN
ncbi:DUF4019 domain-containing protein [Leminorella richardii]|nr:DUF4019 domain-containing protein [Leminorella richardii]